MYSAELYSLHQVARPDGARVRLIQAAFMLLFPGFFFYQTLLGIGAIPAFLGGYFTLVALALTPFLLFAYRLAVKQHANYFTRHDVYCALFVAYCALTLLVNFIFGANPIIVQRYVQSLIFCVDTYIIFRMIDLHDKRFLSMAVLSLVVMSAITIYFSVDGFFFLQALGEAKSPESLATYQGFARSYIYTFLIVLAVSKGMGVRFMLYGIATASLFLNGARSEFSAVLFAIPLVELYYTRHKLVCIIPLVVLLSLLAMNIDSLVGMLPDNRTLQLLDLSHSSSAMARQHLSRDAWRTITESPIFGNFASYPDGHYAHNALCAWVDFGLFGLLFFTGILLFAAFYLFADGYFFNAKSSEFLLACCFICITILWALTAKNVPDMSVGAGLGAFARYRYARTTAERARKNMRDPDS